MEYIILEVFPGVTKHHFAVVDTLEAAVRAAYLPLPASSHAADSTAANLGAGPRTSVAAAAAGTDGTLHAALGGDDVTAAAAGADGANNDIMGVTRVANMGQMQHMVGPLDNMPYYMPFNGRENHEQERKRRTRIKNACQTLRSLVPALSEQTDKATVFEFTVQYLLHLRGHLGSKHDKSISQPALFGFWKAALSSNESGTGSICQTDD
ncbi:uncharacterized protein LOC144115846 [Amblyomma americanum]